MGETTTVIQNILDLTVGGGALWTLVNAFCYFMALVLGMVMVMQLKEVGDGGGRMTYRAPLFTFIAAAMFAAAPSSVDSIAATIYGSQISGSPLSSLTPAGQGNPSFKALLQFVSFMGYVFFISGISVLKKAGQPDRYPQDTVGKATVVLISAMCAIYIDVTLKAIASLTGWDISNYIA